MLKALNLKEIVTMSDTQHVLNRPDTYIGDSSTVEEEVTLITEDGLKNVKVFYSKLALKLFDELFVNSLDHFTRNEHILRNSYRISVYKDKNTVTIRNNFNVIPASEDALKRLFATMRTGTNFDDEENRITGGRNGLGCKLVAIFATEASVTVAYCHSKLTMYMKDHMSKISFGPIVQTVEEDYFEYSYNLTKDKYTAKYLTLVDPLPDSVILSRMMMASYLPIKMSFCGRLLPKFTWQEFANLFCNSHVYAVESKTSHWKIAIGLRVTE